ncbi:MAG: 5-formyltetrahydrofolate cyclo-ligase [Candidatus Gastranaerophilaceae bacterium]
MYTKEKIRLIHKEKRKMLNMKELSEKIVNKFFSLSEFQSTKNIFTYIPLRNEVNTNSILQLKNKNIFVPKIIGREIIMTKFTPLNLTKNKYGILEPENAVPVLPKKNDIIIIPALAADNNFNRLGYGGGYYDRYLRNKEGITIVFIPQVLLISKLPEDIYDVPVDIIITETTICKNIS